MRRALCLIALVVAVMSYGLSGCSKSTGTPTSADTSFDAQCHNSKNPIALVKDFGCFIQSGDGQDILSDGRPTVRVTTQYTTVPVCGQAWISDNSDGYTPTLVTPPGPYPTMTFVRRFMLSPKVLTNGIFKVRFLADDAIEIKVNGVSVASCVPPLDDLGQCQFQPDCREMTIPAGLLKSGRLNVLEVVLTNMLSVNAGGGHYGWTGASYSVCVEPNPIHNHHCQYGR